MFSPSYYRRCQCTGPLKDKEGKPRLNPDGSQKIGSIGTTCPKLGPKHGTWAFYFELEPGEGGHRQRVRRGGFATKDDAKKKAKEIYVAATAGTDVLSDEKCSDFFLRWINAKKSLARTTRHGYTEHIHNYLIPHLGHIKRRDLKVRHLDLMYNAIEKQNAERVLHRLRVEQLQNDCDTARQAWVSATDKKQERRTARRAFLDANKALREGKNGLRRVTSAATMHRINDTLSSALSWGITRESAFTKNWAQFVELPPVTRPKPLVWTPERVEHWKRTGEKPGPVMVWTPELTGAFLDFVKDDWLYELWHSFIFLGPRRGEMCALPWPEVSIDALWMRISTQIVEVAYSLYGEAPKADSVRTVSLSLESGDAFARWREKQQKKREECGSAWIESARVWTHENGEPLHPDWVTRRFKRLIEVSGLPPVRLHDLRHLSATLSLLAKNDIKVVQERLGHASRQITSDTYTSVLPEMMRAEAESVMAVVPRGVSYEVHSPFEIPESSWHNDVAVFFTHAARYSKNDWAIGAQTQPGTGLLGEIRTTGRAQGHASDAALKWIKEHCAASGLELIQVENLTNQYPEDQQPYLSLLRFMIARPASPDMGDWQAPHGQSSGTEPAAMAAGEDVLST